ncbi:prepilin peptidase [Microbacterium bovistercoris]|uniref:Prepilin peptidase n=1 Tax=Microbacterium bovistercoris TaxID=2293570 RepID=A0A371NP09_9MICO|nr:A24 family peptidase [Microbacterium bovistercoris]REJ03921.1 prepilin peptidase [Microbacterium bovistercoris]
MTPMLPEITAALGAAAAGAALGWWPLFVWATTSVKTATLRTPSRVASAVLAAASFALLAWRMDIAILPAVLIFAALGTMLGIVDVAERRLPNTLILWLLGLLAPALVLASALTGDWLRLAWAAVGGVAMFAVYLLLAIISPKSMGMGDVKLAAPIGLLLGWFGLSTWLLGLLAGFICGGLIGIVMLAARRTTLRGSLPFGPSMLAGALVAVLLAG